MRARTGSSPGRTTRTSFPTLATRLQAGPASAPRTLISLDDLGNAVSNGFVGNIVDSAADDPDCAPCSTYYGGLHLHQAVLDSGATTFNRDDGDASKGVPRAMVVGGAVDPPPFSCISSSMWLWKVASETPRVTATDAPTTTCPPVDLRLSANSDDNDRLDMPTRFGSRRHPAAILTSSSSSFTARRVWAASATPTTRATRTPPPRAPHARRTAQRKWTWPIRCRPYRSTAWATAPSTRREQADASRIRRAMLLTHRSYADPGARSPTCSR